MTKLGNRTGTEVRSGSPLFIYGDGSVNYEHGDPEVPDGFDSTFANGAIRGVTGYTQGGGGRRIREITLFNGYYGNHGGPVAMMDVTILADGTAGYELKETPADAVAARLGAQALTVGWVRKQIRGLLVPRVWSAYDHTRTGINAGVGASVNPLVFADTLRGRIRAGEIPISGTVSPDFYFAKR